MVLAERKKVLIDQKIAIDDKRLLVSAEKSRETTNRAGGAEKGRFSCVGDPHPVLAAIAKILLNLVTLKVEVDGDVANAVAGEEREGEGNEGRPVEWEHCLW